MGFVGGVALASVAGARRTASSFSVFWKSTNPSTLVGGTGVLSAPGTGLTAYDPQILNAISSLPHVEKVESESGLNILPLAPDGAPRQGIANFSPGPGNGYASDDGYGFDQDKLSVLAGHMADRRSPYQFMLTAQEAKDLGAHVGSVVRMGIYTNAQINLKGFGTPAVKPFRVVEEKLVGIFLTNAAVVQDESDIGSAPDNWFTPALVDPLLKCCVNYTTSGIIVAGGSRFAAVVQREISTAAEKIDKGLTGVGVALFGDPAANTIPKAQRAIKPEAIALGVFGGIVGLACLLIAAQLIGRQIRLAADERAVLRALGANAVQTWSDGLIGTIGSLVAGAVLAFALAGALSPLAPLGPVRPVYPHPGLSFDWTVLGLGTAGLLATLTGVAAVASYLGAPHRVGRRFPAVPAPSRLLAAAASAGLPLPVLTGARFAVFPGTGRSSVPVRSAILGAVMAVVALVGTVTFAASLRALVDHPSLYGWNWDYLLSAGSNLPEPQTTSLLDHDRYLAAWSGAYTTEAVIDGQAVPVLGLAPGAAVGPALLSGHGVARPTEVVLGPQTARDLHTRVGGDVMLSVGSRPPTRLRVVGTATLPAFGSSGQHLEMGVGAVFDYHLLPARDLNLFGLKDAGPEVVLVRLRPGLNRAAAFRSLEGIARETTNAQNFGVAAIGVQRPAEILNYQSMGATPAYLGAGLAAGAISALTLTLVASVRRRRRDLALLKTLGFTERQLAATVSWHSTISVGIGVLAGVPLGVALGRWLWDLFAQDINAVPAPAVPAGEIAVIALGALVLANVVAAVPGRVAARTPTALVLRSE